MPPQISQTTVDMVRSLDLNPEDWHWATWRSRVPLKRPDPQPFSLQGCLARLAKITTGSYGWEWDWKKANISVSLCPEEANFWLSAIVSSKNDINPKKLAKCLEDKSYRQNFTFEDFMAAIASNKSQYRINQSALHPELVLPLANLFSVHELLTFLDGLDKIIHEYGSKFQKVLYNRDCYSRQGLQQLCTALLQGFRRYLFPYLDSSDIGYVQAQIKTVASWTKLPPDYYEVPQNSIFLASYLGLHAPLLSLIENCPDDLYDPKQVGGYWIPDHYHHPQEVVFGLGSARLVETHLRRLKLRLHKPDYIRAWLAHTEYGALDYIRDSILDQTNKEEAKALTETFALVKAPEAAPFMLELMLSSKAPQVARQWLDANPIHAIAGLLPITVTRGKLAEAAIDWLRHYKRKGHANLIQSLLAEQPAPVQAQIQTQILDYEEASYPPFDGQTTPDWLQQAIAQFTYKPSQKPNWVDRIDLSPVVFGTYQLNPEQIESLLVALKQSKLGNPHPLVLAIKIHGDAESLDRFGWQLFQQWLTDGAPSKENWAFLAVGWLGSDASALKLTPLVRSWPGESQHQRAVMGLECLRVIGTDTALMQINGIAQKLKFKALKIKAQECMEAIAQERGLTSDQLADRIVPDCDLDPQGNRTFDFGSRTFRFVLGPDFKPMLRDENNALKKDLPKPDIKDNLETAQQAIAVWKLLKKQVAEVVKVQTVRLEQAMVNGRRWSVSEFERCFVQHPLMVHLARLLVWGQYAPDGSMTQAFRVTEDRTYADASDDPLVLLAADSIGIAHPMHLSETLKAHWGEILSDYDIISPFPQLGRAVYGLTAAEAKGTNIDRFATFKIPPQGLVGMLEKCGWTRGCPGDSGVFSDHFKPLTGANITAVVAYYGVPMGYMEDWDKQSIEYCYFLPGLYSTPSYFDRRQAIPLNQVDPIAISEVLGDLTAIATTAQAQ